VKIGAANSQPAITADGLRNITNEISHPAKAREKEESIKGAPNPVAEVHPPAHATTEIDAAVNKVNSALDAFSFSLRFKIHDESNRVMVQVIDKETDELIREIPPERLLRLAAQIQEMIGLLLDTRR
jgi:flagellar protein FlaG